MNDSERTGTTRGPSLACLLLASTGACGTTDGPDAALLTPPSQLSSGMVFASRAFPGARGYELWAAPVPSLPTAEVVPATRLTQASGDDVQPSTAPDRPVLAFARRGDGIFFADESGTVHRVSQTAGTDFLDSLPAVSFGGTHVAWVRERTDRPIAGTGFYESEIMLANRDGSDARALLPRPGIVQDAPRFRPTAGPIEIAWLELDPQTMTAAGPTRHGLWVHDARTGSGRYLCTGPVATTAGPIRCFGQHLDWPEADTLVLGQPLLELNRVTGAAATIRSQVVAGLGQSIQGVPVTTPNPNGFHPAFPLSVHFQPAGAPVRRALMDGLIAAIDGDQPSLGFVVANPDGSGVWRLDIAEHGPDFDLDNTQSYLFSLATPQFIP